MWIKRVVHSKVIPDDRPAGAQDAVDFPTDVARHLMIANRSEHCKQCDQIKKAVRERQRLGIGLLKRHLREIVLCASDTLCQQINAEKIFQPGPPRFEASQNFARAATHIQDAPVTQREKTRALQQLLQLSVAFLLDGLIATVCDRPFRYAPAAFTI